MDKLYIKYNNLKDIIITYTKKVPVVSRGEVQSTSTLNDWAGYVNKINKQDRG